MMMLLDAEANPNTKANEGWTCIMMAAREADMETCRLLLDAGAVLLGGSDMFGQNALAIVHDFIDGRSSTLLPVFTGGHYART